MRIHLLFLLFISSVATFSQQGELFFETKEYDFGKIKELDGPVNYTYFFVNKGGNPIQVEKVEVQCGCTTPSWTETAVAPGDTGFIEAEFDPSNKPGEFEKYLTIYTNGKPAIDEVKFTGTVIPKPSVIEDSYPYAYADSLLFMDKYLKFGLLTTEKPVEKSFLIYNSSNDTLRVEQDSTSTHLSFRLTGDQLLPRTEGELRITYDPVKKNDFGSYLRDYVSIPFVGTDTLVGTKTVIASIEEYFPEMTAEELARSPKIEVISKVSLGTVKEGSETKTTVTIRNSGEESLILHKIYSSCQCIRIEQEAVVLNAGESTNVNVYFDATARQGRQTKKIMIYANSPKKPYTEITLEATVAP